MWAGPALPGSESTQLSNEALHGKSDDIVQSQYCRFDYKYSSSRNDVRRILLQGFLNLSITHLDRSERFRKFLF